MVAFIPLEQRLLSRRTIDADGCWMWTGSTGRGGYGQIAIQRNGREYGRRVHRVAAMLWLGFDLESDFLVCHHCDKPACFNPAHLFVGTPRDNTADMIAKGRRQEKLGRTPSWTEEQMDEALRALRHGMTLREAQRQFGINKTTLRSYAPWYVPPEILPNRNGGRPSSHDPEQMAKAVEAVRNGSPVRVAAREFGVPRTSLKRYVLGQR